MKNTQCVCCQRSQSWLMLFQSALQYFRQVYARKKVVAILFLLAPFVPFGTFCAFSGTQNTMKITVGKVLKAQGIKGEMKASCTLDSPEMLKNVRKLFLESTPHDVVKIRCDGGFFYVRFADICDRNGAEDARGCSILCEKDDLQLDDGRYFIDDVLGCNVVLDDGQQVGTVTDVLQYGAADVYVCKNGEKEISFPFLKDLVLQVNVSSKRIVLNAARFAEVVLYED